MLGLIPLKSFKMATYLHEKVPGINLTQEILDRVEKGGKEAGTEIAIETLEQIKKNRCRRTYYAFKRYRYNITYYRSRINHCEIIKEREYKSEICILLLFI